jgi:hypothetical protein
MLETIEMIPSWKILFQGFACGVFTVGTIAQAMRVDLVGVVICALLAATFFFFGASNADKLRWRASDAGKGE